MNVDIDMAFIRRNNKDDHENDPTQNLTPPVKTEFVPTKSGDKFRYKKCSFKTGLNV